MDWPAGDRSVAAGGHPAPGEVLREEASQPQVVPLLSVRRRAVWHGPQPH
jgi:hypothetical protein